MPRRHSNSMAEIGMNGVRIESGRVINVNQTKWLVDVRTQHSGRELVDIEIGSSYLHFNRGEGIYAMPEVGANVKACMPSESPPFVLCFVGGFEQENEEDTFRSGRPPAKPGDLIMRGRDGNQVWLHRGGVLELGSKTMPRSFYIPLQNLIRDLTLRYELFAGGGHLKWEVENADTNDTDHPPSILTLLANDLSDDEKGSVRIKVGHVSDDERLEVVVAPQALDHNGNAGSGQVYRFVVNKDGDVDVETKGDLYFHVEGDSTIEMDGELTATIGSSMGIDVTSSIEVTAGNKFELSATQVSMDISGSTVIDCPTIQLGGSGGTKPLVLATPAFIQFMLTHGHQFAGATVGPPSSPLSPTAYQASRARGK